MGRINLAELYRTAFHVLAPGYPKDKAVINVPGVTSFSQNNVPGIKERQLSVMGTPLFMPVMLDGYQLPNTPLIAVTGSKTIVKTAIDGNEGTFKELFALNDYQVSIKGIAVQMDGSDEFPQEQIRKIREIFEKRKSVEVVNELLALFNINLLSLEALSIPEVEGAQSWQPYEITCSSDKAFDLELKQS
jgi:hypothetical protein